MVNKTVQIASKKSSHSSLIQTLRHLTQTSSGAFLAKPQKLSLGITKFFIVVTPFVYIGGMISMSGASLLEDYDIFVPEDEDDWFQYCVTFDNVMFVGNLLCFRIILLCLKTSLLFHHQLKN